MKRFLAATLLVSACSRATPAPALDAAALGRATGFPIDAAPPPDATPPAAAAPGILSWIRSDPRFTKDLPFRPSGVELELMMKPGSTLEPGAETWLYARLHSSLTVCADNRLPALNEPYHHNFQVVIRDEKISSVTPLGSDLPGPVLLCIERALEGEYGSASPGTQSAAYTATLVDTLR